MIEKMSVVLMSIMWFQIEICGGAPVPISKGFKTLFFGAPANYIYCSMSRINKKAKFSFILLELD